MAKGTEVGVVVREPEVVDIKRQGKEIIIPPGMKFDDAIKWLQRRRDEDEQEIVINRTVTVFPSEGAKVTARILADRYGWVKAEMIPALFGSNPPALMDIEVGFGEVEQVPFGRFSIPNIRGFIQTGSTLRDGLPCFTIAAKVKAAHRVEITELFDEIQKACGVESIYRGKAIRLPFIPIAGAEERNTADFFPKFLDVRSADLKSMVFSRDIEELLMDNVFGPVLHTESFRSAGIPLKMGVLLEGEYGCGKTLVANLLAKVCEDNRWTYILCEDAADLARCVKVARRFEPAVVFCEDIDREVAGQKRTKSMDMILNTIDGIESKGTEIMVVLTTNHVDDLTPAMRRPGRLDVVVPVGPPDAEAVRRMIMLYGRDQIAVDADLTEVGELLANRTPAVVREVVERAKRSAIVLGDGEVKPERLTGEALARAARGMKRHLDLLEIKPEPAKEPAKELSDAIRYLADSNS